MRPPIIGGAISVADPAGRSSRCSRHDSHWPVEGPPPPGGTGLPLDLSGHAAKVLIPAAETTSGTLPPRGMLTDDRCQLAPCRTLAIEGTRPLWESETTSTTPFNPRRINERRNWVQNAWFSLGPTSTPSTW